MQFSTAFVAAVAALTASAAPVEKRNAFLDGTTVFGWWEGLQGNSLTSVCDTGDFNVVGLSFLTYLNPPTLNLASNTGKPSAAQTKAGFSKLFDGTVKINGVSVADQIQHCQSKGIKVMISFGGTAGISDATFSSTKEAQQAADYVWDLFLGGKSDARPFGSVVLDGIDMDNETGNGAYYVDFVKALRGKGKTLISADPMCGQVGKTGTDTSIPDDALALMDFVNVQFYNDLQNGIGSKGFENNIKQWASKLVGLNKNLKLMMGMPGSHDAATGAGPADQTPSQIQDTIKTVQGWKLPGFGGAAIWEASYSMANTENGLSFNSAVKKALLA